MYAPLFRSVIFPTLDRMNRTHIGRVLAGLRETESYTESDLLQLQQEKLSRILPWTRDASAFYRRFWETAPDSRRARSVYAELDGIPVVSKEDLRPHLGEFPVPAFRGRAIKVNTSGSTGAPMTYYRSAEQESWFWALRLRMWQWAGYRPGEPYLAINLNQRTAWKKRLQDLLFRCTYLTYNADNQKSEAIVELLSRRRITHINAFGSCLLALAQHMRHNSIANPGVRVLTSTGDNLFPEQRKTIEDTFGVKVCDYYGAGGEGVHLASQCAEEGGYHLHMENAIVEILKDGRPAQSGEVGQVVVTQLDNYAMPLIRYDLGDLATVGAGDACPCGRLHPKLASVDGRACDIVRTPEGGALLPQFFFIGPFKLLEKVYRYQIVQERIEGITVKLVAEEGCDRGRAEESIAVEIARATNGSLGVTFEWVDEIPLAGLGKPRPVISKL